MAERGIMSKIKHFHGGVHPADHKTETKDLPIVRLLPGEVLSYPISQHIGAAAIPCVKAGEHIRRGQVIAKANGFFSVPIHSAVSGKVREITSVWTARGEKCDAVVIENDGAYDTIPTYGMDRDPALLTAEVILDLLQQSGVVGMGGAGFPLHAKLKVREPDAIQMFIVNGAECEPYLTCDHRLMMERAESLCRGILLLLRLFPSAEAVIALEENKREVAAYLQDLFACERRIRIALLPTRYPQGGEHMLIYALTGRRLRAGQLPFDLGCVVVNVASVIAADDALEHGMPLTERVMTLSGDAIAKPCNLSVSIGDSLAHVIAAAGGFSTQPQTLIAGGPMMGTTLFTTEIPITKTFSGLLAFQHVQKPRAAATACIRCGACVRVCPEKLIPQALAQSADRNLTERFIAGHGLSCIECGCCAYSCPAGLPLVHSIRYGKRLARKENLRKEGQKA